MGFVELRNEEWKQEREWVMIMCVDVLKVKEVEKVIVCVCGYKNE